MIDFSAAPVEPLARLLWLSGAREALLDELDREWQTTYFSARAEGKMQAALDLHLHSRKRVMAYTRHENEARGRCIARWGDGF